MLVENDEIIEYGHHRRDGGNRHFLERRHARRAVAMRDPQHAALLLRQCRRGSQPQDQHPDCGRKRFTPPSHWHFVGKCYLSSQMSSKRQPL
jgi:hypothetical protein